AIFFGLLFFWASKRKVTRASADDRNARRVGGKVAGTHEDARHLHATTKSKVTGFLPSQE
ncbi:hypothetical protein, partial [Dyella sp. AtDHG13]|uniref:hypothetical protein n=1 Tax=Dyella sp. AtDHG13 TaxID=1938897 RepID=UPI001F485EF6